MRKLSMILLAVVVRILLMEPALGQQLTAPVTETNTQRADFAADGTIRIDDSYGDLSVEGWDQPELEITITKSMPYDYKPGQPLEVTKRLAEVQVVTKRSSENEFVIATKVPTHRTLFSSKAPKTRDVSIEYRLRVPRHAKLVIHHTTGTVLVNGVAGDIEATSGRGDIVLMLSDAETCSIDARTKFGSIDSDFEGSSRKQHLLGRAFTGGSTSASRTIRLRMGYGGITIKAGSS